MGLRYFSPAVVAQSLSAHAADTLVHSSGRELAYAENITGTTQTITTTAIDVDGCAIVIPPTTRPVWVEGQGVIDVSTAPLTSTTGTAQLSVMFGTVYVSSTILSLEFGNANGYLTMVTRGRLAPSATPRTIRLTVNRGGSTWAGIIGNGFIDPAFRSYIAAFEA